MNKLFSDKRIFVLICLNAALYAVFLTLDIRNANGFPEVFEYADSILKYAAIVSCLLMCLFAFSHSSRRAARIQAIVFCFTLGADFFLLFTDFFAAGVFVFLGAHICALIRYRRRWLPRVCILAAALFTIALLLLSGPFNADTGTALTAALCFAYGTLIISVTVSTFHPEHPARREYSAQPKYSANTEDSSHSVLPELSAPSEHSAYYEHSEQPRGNPAASDSQPPQESPAASGPLPPRESIFFSRLGMLLFIACDINVLLKNIIPRGNVLFTVSIVLMWAFYLPAQTLLALSATDLPLIRGKR